MLGVWQGVADLLRSRKANKALNQLQSQDPTYQFNPLVNQQLGLAKNMFYGQMPGFTQEQQGIFSNQADNINNINRNATDSSQALALASGAQGQTNQALANLGLQQQQYKQSMLGNLNNAYANSINEGDKVFQDLIRRFGDKAQIQGQIQQNKTNALNGIFNGFNSDINQALQIAGLGMNSIGGNLFSKITGGGGGGGNQVNNTNPLYGI